MHLVYIVVDNTNAPGRIYGVFGEEDAAEDFRQHYHSQLPRGAEVLEYEVFYGQQLADANGFPRPTKTRRRDRRV